MGPSERRRASALVRAEIYHVWRDWELANPAARRALTEGQWHDLTCTIALALRRTTAAAVVEECTRALGTARDLAAVVGSRLWALIRGSAEWPEWAEYRRGLMRSVEPSWTWPTPPGVVGLASARAALRRARGGVERVGTQLELVGAAANPSAHADQARRAVGVAAMGAERYRYGQVIPDTERPGLAEMLTAAAAVARSIAAAIPTRPVVDRAEAERIRAEAAAYSAKVDAERPALRAAALAEARASRRARGKDR